MPDVTCLTPNPSEVASPNKTREYGERINNVPGPTPNTVTEQGIEHRSDGEGKASIVGKEAEGESDDAIDCPAVKPPVKDGRRYADGRGFRRPGGNAKRRVLQVVHRLRHPEKQQTNAHACREEHGKPGQVGVFRFRIHTPEAHLAEWRDRHNQTKQKDKVGGDHEQPIKVRS